VSAPLLAIDTATDVASVAVGSAEHAAAVRSVRGARQHAAQLVPLIQQVLAVAKLRLEQITGISVGDGPGSFTGLRIGWAAAKGIAHERALPLIAIPSLLGAAHAAHGETAGPSSTQGKSFTMAASLGSLSCSEAPGALASPLRAL